MFIARQSRSDTILENAYRAHYLIATVTMFVGAPLITARNGMAAPVAAFNGILTFSCQIPTIPGASPEN